MEVERHLLQGSKSSHSVVEESEKLSTCFDCCICLENARDPVATLCGHLYCWPCIYKWLQFQGSTLSSGENTRCPVCKSEVSQTSVVPIFIGGQNVSEAEVDDKIPPRPTAVAWRSKSASLARRGQSLRHENSYQNMQNFQYPGTPSSSPALSSPGLTTPAAVCHPMVGMFGEMVYARVFGDPQSIYAYPNSYYSAGSGSPRFRRQEIKIYKSLNRVSFFLFCCLLLCFLLF